MTLENVFNAAMSGWKITLDELKAVEDDRDLYVKYARQLETELEQLKGKDRQFKADVEKLCDAAESAAALIDKLKAEVQKLKIERDGLALTLEKITIGNSPAFPRRCPVCLMPDSAHKRCWRSDCADGRGGIK